MVYGGSSQAREVAAGRPAFIATGRAAPEVKYLAVIKDGYEDRRPLESHFGAWVSAPSSRVPWVAGLDANGMFSPASASVPATQEVATRTAARLTQNTRSGAVPTTHPSAATRRQNGGISRGSRDQD